MPTSVANGLNLNGARIQLVGNATEAQDAVTLNQLTQVMQGIKGVKDPVRVAAGANISVSSPGTTIDGVTMALGDRVLLTAQSTANENGIYVYNGSSSAMTRASDADAAGEIVDGTVVSPAEGANSGWIYRQQTTPSGAIGSWAQTWVQYQQGSAYTAGTGIQISGGVIALVVPVAISSGGTGATSAAGARANIGALGKFAATIGDGTATSFTITHNLGTQDVFTQLYEVATGAEWLVDVTGRTTNAVTLSFANAPTASRFRVVVGG